MYVVLMYSDCSAISRIENNNGTKDWHSYTALRHVSHPWAGCDERT